MEEDLEAGDPYNPNLTLDKEDFSVKIKQMRNSVRKFLMNIKVIL